MIVIYFGDNDASIADQAKKKTVDAFLVDFSNYKEFLLSNNDCVCYTSLADLPKNVEIAVSILAKADKIIYCPPEKWSDGKKLNFDTVHNCIQGLTETLLIYMSEYVEIENIDLCIEKKYLNPLVDGRKTDEKQLWIAGCSVSHGDGVKEEEKYGNLLSKKLNIPCSFLTKPGSSIRWAASQILKSDIRRNDIVCWGITTFARFPFYYNNRLEHLNSSWYIENKRLNKIFPIDMLDSENTLYQSVQAIDEVINFCEKIQAQLIMFDALSDHHLNRILKNKNNYHKFPWLLNKNVKNYESYGLFTFYDLGNDGEHPGIITHKKYSEFLAQLIK